MRFSFGVCVVALSVFSWAYSAHGQLKVSPKEISQAVEAANTPFKRCISQSHLHETEQVILSKDQLKEAEEFGLLAEMRMADRYNGGVSLGGASGGNLVKDIGGGIGNAGKGLMKSTGLGSMFGGKKDGGAEEAAEVTQVNQLLMSLGNGYAAQSQTWLRPFNSGEPQLAAVMLAHEAPTDLMRKKKNRKDPTRLSDEDVAKKAGVVGLVERGLVSLTAGDLECSVNFFDVGIRRSDREQGSLWGADLDAYEHIMSLNMKAIGYLLAGDERARNMANASREMQGIARDRYREEIEAYKEEAETEAEEKQVGLVDFLGLHQAFETAFGQSALSANTDIANRMATPYVNPLPDYLSAVVAETEALAGTGARDEWSRAAIAWSNASALAPSGQFLKAASAQARGWENREPPAGQKIVHVLVGTGAAPTDAVSRTYLNINDQPFPVMMPVKVPHTQDWAGGSIRVGGQQANLEMVSDIESMVMRQSEDKRGAEMMSAIVRGFAAYKAAGLIGGSGGNPLTSIGSSIVRDRIAEPSTESWSSLPQAYYAARLVVPVSQNSVQVNVPGSGVKVFPLLPEGATFVFATAKPDVLLGKAQRVEFGRGSLDFRVQ